MPEGNGPLHSRNWVENRYTGRKQLINPTALEKFRPTKEAECFMFLPFCSISFKSRISKALKLYLCFYS